MFSGFRAIALLAAAFFVIDVVGLLRTNGTVQRFSPLTHLDPISAGNICALGAVAVLVLRPRSRWAKGAQLTLAAAFLAASAASGSRGPLVAGVVGCSTFMFVKRRWTDRVLVMVMLVCAIGAGAIVAESVGTFAYLSDTVAGSPVRDRHHHKELPAISTVHIRREWLTTAFRQSVDRPVFGHGVAQFVDNTPEARRMGIAGERTYPHNSFAEAAFSLGLMGVIPYLVAAVGTAVALVRIRRARLPAAACVWGITGVAVVSTAVSGRSERTQRPGSLWRSAWQRRRSHLSP